MIDEIGKSVRAVLYERVTSPLLGALSISWILCNWKFLAVLFSDAAADNIYHKLNYIQDNLSAPYNLIWEPVGLTAVILIVYPFLAAGGTIAWEYGRHLKIRIRDHFDAQNSISADRARELKNLVIRLLEQEATSLELLNRGNKPDPQSVAHKLDEEDEVTIQNKPQALPPFVNENYQWGGEYSELSKKHRFVNAMNKILEYFPNNIDSFEEEFPEDYKYLYALQFFEAHQGNRPHNRITPKGNYFIKLHVMNMS